MVTEHEENRRDFLMITTGAVGAIGVAGAAWPFIKSMSPSADVLAQAQTEVDISTIAEGQMVTIPWQGKPIFVLHRTQEQIDAAVADDGKEMREPEKDADRVQKQQWLVLLALCTHLGCIPQPIGSGEYDGFLCPCHGTHYDTSGRIRKGPAPKNLPVPFYEFKDDTTLVIGKPV